MSTHHTQKFEFEVHSKINFSNKQTHNKEIWKSKIQIQTKAFHKNFSRMNNEFAKKLK
jgi:hypothetical protein